MGGSNDVGGRRRTDRIDGFLPSAASRCAIRLPTDRRRRRLRLNGTRSVRAAVRRQALGGRHTAADTGRLPAMPAGGGGAPRDAVEARWALPALRPKMLTSPSYSDTQLVEALNEARVGGEMRRVLDRFLAGVLLDDTGETSNAFALLLARMFVLATPDCPPTGWLRCQAASPPPSLTESDSTPPLWNYTGAAANGVSSAAAAPSAAATSWSRPTPPPRRH